MSKSGTSLSGHEAIDSVTIPEIKRQVLENLADGKENPYFALPKRMKVTFTLTVHANTLRPGQTLRCWLPLPRQDVARQTDFKFIEAGANGAAYRGAAHILGTFAPAQQRLYGGQDRKEQTDRLPRDL